MKKSYVALVVALGLLAGQEAAAKSAPTVSPSEILGLQFAVQHDNGQDVLARLRKIAKKDAIGALPYIAIYSSVSELNGAGLKAESDEFAYQLFKSGKFEKMLPDIQEFLADRALSHAVVSHHLEDVGALLNYIHSPASLVFLLSFREYEPAWPEIEQYAGDHLARPTDDYVKWTKARLDEKPEDHERLVRYVEALLFAGQDAEAINAVTEGFAQNKRQGLGENDGWALGAEADALDGLGRTGEADQIYDLLAKLSPEENPWVINFVINRAIRLINQGRWEEGLTASKLALSTAQSGTPYARAIVHGHRACAFYKLGKATEGARELDDVKASATAASGMVAITLLCAGREDEASAWILNSINDPKTGQAFLNGLQAPGFSSPDTGSSNLPDLREFIMRRPELLEEVKKHIRFLPERFILIGYLRHQQNAGGPAPS